jgi:hypothetical protein
MIYTGGDEECIQNFSEEISEETAIWKTEKEMGI